MQSQTNLYESLVFDLARQISPEAPIELPYKFYGGNEEVFRCRDTESIVAGPAETGKTLAQLVKIHLLAYKYPGAQFSIIRKKKTDLYGSVINTFTRDILTKYGPGVKKYGGAYPQWYDYPGGSRIWLGGLDDPGKTLSSERDGIYVNQAEELSLPDWEYLTRCITGRGSIIPQTFLTGDCNPGPPSHWIKLREVDKKLSLFETTHKDNPTLWDGEGWTEQGHRTLKILSDMTGSRKMRLYHGIWALLEGSIYSIFEGEYGKHKVHAFSPNRYWPRIVAVDPFGAHIAALWMAYDPDAGVLNVYREYREPFGVTTPRHVENIIEMTEGETIAAWVGGGPSERQSRVDFTSAGIPLIEPPIGGVWEGIDRVIQLLKDFRLVIHDSCPNLLSEIGDYRRKLRDGVATDTIVNKDTYDMLDCLRYGCAFLLHPIETGEQVVYNPVIIGNY